MMDNISASLEMARLPGLEREKTAPAETQLLWTNGVDIYVPGWGENGDQALSRSLMPDDLGDIDDPSGDEFGREFVLRPPTYGRADAIVAENPTIVDGVKFPMITRKGVGTRLELEEKGVVYGIMKDQSKFPRKMYKGGVETISQFLGDAEMTHKWKEARLRVREPARLFSLDKVITRTGFVDLLNYDWLDVGQPCIEVWMSRGAFTYQDIVEMLTPNKRVEANDVESLKKLSATADRILKLERFFLQYEDDPRAADVVGNIERELLLGESSWFEYQAEMYGEQSMRKTMHGIVHGEMHRQNIIPEVEFKDLADFGGIPKNGVEKLNGSWDEVKKNSFTKDALILENLMVLAAIINQKLIFNAVHNREWDNQLGEIVAKFADGMRNEDGDRFAEVFQFMQEVSLEYKAFEPGPRLEGISNLCFRGKYDEGEPLFGNTPQEPIFLVSRMYDYHEEYLHPDAMRLRREDFAFICKRFRDKYKIVLSDPQESMPLFNLFNKIVDDKEMFTNISRAIEQVDEKGESLPLHTVLTNVREIVTANLNKLGNSDPRIVELIIGETGILDSLSYLTSPIRSRKQLANELDINLLRFDLNKISLGEFQVVLD